MLRSVVFMALALLALLLSRVPFMLDNPDWGPVLLSERCGLLTVPLLRDHIQTCSEDGAVPISIVAPDQLLTHYHLGSAVLHHMVSLLYEVTGTRSLLLLKIIGTAFTAVYVIMMAWVLPQLFRHQWLPVVVPVALIIAPPGMFLWYTLLPIGHYSDHHFFYALFLPFMMVVAWNKQTRTTMVLLGVLGGFASAYTFTNALFPAAILAFYFLDSLHQPNSRLAAPQQLKHLLRVCTDILLASGGGMLVFLRFGRVRAVWGRISANNTVHTDSVQLNTSTGQADLTLSQIIERVGEIGAGHQRALFEPFIDGVDANPPFAVSVYSHFAAVVFVLGAIVLITAVVRRFSTSSLSKVDACNQRFLAQNGVLLLGSLTAYLIMGPAWDRGGAADATIVYLLPIYPPLFVGAGALFAVSALSRTPLRRTLSILFAAALVLPLLRGLVVNYQYNAAPRNIPDHTHCDERFIGSYFWTTVPEEEQNPTDLDIESRLFRADFDAGVECCEASQPGDNGACRYASYLARIMGHRSVLVHPDPETIPFDCSQVPEEDRLICAEAYGALSGSCTDSDSHQRNRQVCSQFDGDAYDACLFGAFRGTFHRAGAFDCMNSILDLCEAGFEQPHAYSSCAEQIGALVYGMPALPPASEPMAGVCEMWPRPWSSLCQRARRLADEPCREPDEMCCEDVYQEFYAEEVPENGSLSFNTCLETASALYPYCAIGVARQRGETDCRWRGSLHAGHWTPRRDVQVEP